MRDDEFAKWLERDNRLGDRPRRDARSRCKRIERYEGCIDKHFVQDEMKRLLNVLTYSRTDEEAGVSAQQSFGIEGDVVNGIASLKHAARLYFSFCKDCPPNRATCCR